MPIIHSRKITIVKVSKPVERDINKELQWLGHSLGLFNMRDKDRSCYRIFLELLKHAKTGEGLTSDELADKLNLSRGTVVHHLNKLMDSGIVVHQKNKYLLRVDRLERLIDEVQRDLLITCRNLREVAKDLDKMLS